MLRYHFPSPNKYAFTIIQFSYPKMLLMRSLCASIHLNTHFPNHNPTSTNHVAIGYSLSYSRRVSLEGDGAAAEDENDG